MVGSVISAMVTTVAPTTPFAAASSTPTSTTEIPRPPGNAPNSRPIVSSRSSAMRERSSITPMKMNSGMASSTALVITPKRRCGSAPRRPTSMAPNAWPISAKARDTPPSVSATGYPAISRPHTASTSRMARSSGRDITLSPFPLPAWQGREKDRSRPDRLRHALQREQQREQRDQRLEQEHERQSAGLARAFENGPRALHIGKRETGQRDHERQQQEQRAEKVDPRLGARRGTRVEHVDAHVAVRFQRPRRRQQEQRRMRVKDRLLQPDRADAEHIAHQHHRKGDQHDGQRAPRGRAAHGAVQAIDTIRKGCEKHRRSGVMALRSI